LYPEVLSLIEQTTNKTISIVSEQAVSGGCINEATVFHSSTGESYFVKSNQNLDANVFAAEASGLNAMSATNSLRIPTVICHGALESGGAFLVLEKIDQGTRPNGFFETFGRQLAEMHRQGRSEQFGFDSNNWLGSSIQLNPAMDDWNQFWIEARLIPQLKMARDNKVSNQKLQQLGERLINRIDKIFGSSPEPPSLIHGDLWSGNYFPDENGQPAIFDPACYYAHREAEFGMTKLFGGFPTAFYHAYEEAWPLTEGWESRGELYTLYHLLNHLNLFGGSYLGSCLEILERHS